jgi:hypothetical protein
VALNTGASRTPTDPGRRDFVQASARVTITDGAVEVRFGKRAHNPYLLDAGFADTDIAVPWWEGRRLRLEFG